MDDGQVKSDANGHNAAQRAVLWILATYQSFSRNTPPMCRYTPTCSEYMRIAVSRYGCLRGGWMGIRRILRCHPFHHGGHDPVP